MVELLIIAVVILVVWNIVRKRPSVKENIDKSFEKYAERTNLEPRPEIIEDSSFLKADLASAREQLDSVKLALYDSLNEMGGVRSQLKLSQSANLQTGALLLELQQDFAKLQSQTKSSQVRVGFLGETMLPLMEQFPVDPKSMRFLGSPIDYISFCYVTNKVTFVEVKTGDSVLNENQRAVKKMVEEGRVEFKVVRLNEKGMKVK